MNRRTLLRSTGTLGSALLAGCSTDSESVEQPTARRSERTTSGPTATATPDAETELTETTEEKQGDDVPTEEVEIGVVYIPFMGSKWDRCSTAGEPAAGNYDDTYDPQVVDRQIDYLLDHNVSTVLFNFGEEDEDYRRFEAFLEADRASEINIECFYVISQAMRRGRDIERDFAYLREQFFPLENYSRRDGRRSSPSGTSIISPGLATTSPGQ